ncbi:MAG: class I SAM-dependent methyltransferase [Gammaproteobacteria bacterium]
MTTISTEVMGIYQDRIFPKLNGHLLGAVELEELRADLLAQAVGHVLEIGSGTGTNFIYYSRAITSLTTCEPNESLNHVARRYIRQMKFPIAQKSQVVENLTAPDAAFDTVVSTFVLCSVSDLQAGLQQIKRVLKPGGKFLFVERSRSADQSVAKWQHKLTPFHRLLGNGSHLDRAIIDELRAAGFSITRSEQALVPRIPRALGSLVYGEAALPVPV